jgi:hypothetical protein
MGGVYNTVNLHVYHYAGNNPVKYVDPDGEKIDWVQGEGVTEDQMVDITNKANKLMNSGTAAGNRFKEIYYAEDVKVTIKVNKNGASDCDAENWDNAANGIGSNSTVRININDKRKYERESAAIDAGATLAHEVSGHAYDIYKGISPYNRNKPTWPGRFHSEENAVAMENEYRSSAGLHQRTRYDNNWYMPIYAKGQNMWYAYSARFVFDIFYDRDEKPPRLWRP